MTGVEEIVGVAALGGPVAQILAIILVTVFAALSTVAWVLYKHQRSEVANLNTIIGEKNEAIKNLTTMMHKRGEQLTALAEKTNEVLSASNLSIIRLRDTLKAVQEELIRIKERCND